MLSSQCKNQFTVLKRSCSLKKTQWEKRPQRKEHQYTGLMKLEVLTSCEATETKVARFHIFGGTAMN